MKINDKEVAHYALQQDGVVKESVLHKKGEKDKDKFMPKCFVLKGNMLFYFKGQTASGTPVGCVVLERTSIQDGGEITQKKGPTLFCFKIAFECANQRVYHIGCESPAERDEWMAAIKSASFGFLRDNIARLQQKLDALEASSPQQQSRGSKPSGKARSATRSSSVPAINLAAGKLGSVCITMVSCEDKKGSDGAGNLSMVLSVAAKSLPMGGNGAPPNTRLVIQERASARSPWSDFVRTEDVYTNPDPVFSKPVRFDFPSSSGEKMVANTELRVLVENLTVTQAQAPAYPNQMDVPTSHGPIDRQAAEAKLKANGVPGDFLIRDRALAMGPGATCASWAYSFFGMNGKCSHLRVDMDAQTGYVSFNGAVEQALAPGSNLVVIINHLNQSRRAKGLTVGTHISPVNHNAPSGRSTTEAALVGWAECRLGDIADERDIVIDVEPPETMDADPEPMSPSRASMVKLLPSGPAPKLKLSRRMNFKFNVPTTATGGMKLLLVEQLMGESPFFLSVPAQLLNLFINADKTSLALYEGLGHLQGKLGDAKERVHNAIMARVQTNLEHVAFIDSYKGAAFKSSVDKKSKALEMFTMNLHIETLKVMAGRARKAGQRTIVTGDTSEAQYMTFTHGAFVAHAEGFKHGGLLKILQAPLNRAAFEPLRRIRNVRSNVVIFEDEVRNMDTEIMRFLHESDFNNRDLRAQLEDQIGEFNEAVAIFEAELSKEVVSQAYTAAARVYGSGGGNGNERVGVEDVLAPIRVAAKHMMTSLEELCTVLSKGCSPDVQNNLKASLKSAVTKLKHACNGATSESIECLLIHELQIEPPEDVEYEEVIHRRDMCFCQALTAVVTAVNSMLTSPGDKDMVFEQIAHIGHLVNFQSLLSTQGHEMGMIEDMAQAVRDVGRVRVRLREPEDGRNPLHVEITGQRYFLIVDLTIDANTLALVPDSFIEEGIKIVPIMFSQGINEMQMLARNIGDTLLQEQLCEENFKLLQQYAKEFKALAFEKKYDKSDIAEIDRALAELDKAIRSRSFKHALDILTQSAQAARRLNGSRFISCKSGKDRTGMSVTYEECQILADRHQMDPKFMQHALDVTRSKGVRIMNVEKNIGEPRYAFNKLQLMALPKLFRPPIISIGSSTT